MKNWYNFLMQIEYRKKVKKYSNDNFPLIFSFFRIFDRSFLFVIHRVPHLTNSRLNQILYLGRKGNLTYGTWKNDKKLTKSTFIRLPNSVLKSQRYKGRLSKSLFGFCIEVGSICLLLWRQTIFERIFERIFDVFLGSFLKISINHFMRFFVNTCREWNVIISFLISRLNFYQF